MDYSGLLSRKRVLASRWLSSVMSQYYVSYMHQIHNSLKIFLQHRKAKFALRDGSSSDFFVSINFHSGRKCSLLHELISMQHEYQDFLVVYDKWPFLFHVNNFMFAVIHISMFLSSDAYISLKFIVSCYLSNECIKYLYIINCSIDYLTRTCEITGDIILWIIRNTME
jgi:hypothetical protein